MIHYRILLICILILFIALKSAAPVSVGKGGKSALTTPDTGYDRWEISSLNTASNVEFLSKVEQEVVVELNLLRGDPAQYAEKYLKPYREYYNGRKLDIPGRITLLTGEGIKPLDECISQLSRMKPLPALTPSEGMCKAARDHANDQSKTGRTGHDGSDGSTLPERLNRYGKWLNTIGENIDYGNGNAREIIIALLIDDGVASRGHRKNMLNGAYLLIGVAVGTHPRYEYLCVMDFAGGYE